MAMFLSDCGEYILITKSGHGSSYSDVYLRDGSRHWVHDERVKTWKDAKVPRKALPFCIGGYSCTKNGEKKGTFTVTLLDCNTEKEIVPWTGNTVIQSLDVKFRRKIPSNHYAAWKKRLGIM
jgi:hypothetical protein